ncbi:hypothetical protein SDC9_95666 [bioreactor metagenome]|uniref:Uncharacterized protein n=1 Tax=bioreactor metagenome TaxID=1076179 RepID=A0A645A6Z6_9ZZZZ
MPSAQANGLELIGSADVDRNGAKESIYLDKSRMDSDLFVTLRVMAAHGHEIWNQQLATAHVGWGMLFLCEQNGEFYLLRYNPTMYQGYCTYTYTLFTLEGGVEHVVRSNMLEFDINGNASLNATKMVGFADEINSLLEKSTLLVSTDGGAYSFGPSPAVPFYERYSWLDGFPELFENSDDLATRLEKFSGYALSNRR